MSGEIESIIDERSSKADRLPTKRDKATCCLISGDELLLHWVISIGIAHRVGFSQMALRNHR